MENENYRLLILEGMKIRKAETSNEWAEFMEISNRRIAIDYFVSERYGMIAISTVFLGIPHPGGIFETMVFREKGTDDCDMPPLDDLACMGFWGEMRRYKTYEGAETGHREIVDKITMIISST